MVNLKKHNSNNNVDQQLNRLSKISEKMSEYISSGDLQLINQNDKVVLHYKDTVMFSRKNSL